MEIDMSLDDIIQKKRNSGFRPIKKGFVEKNRGRLNVKKFNTGSGPKVIDARNKIIQKKRLQIRDAREKLMPKNYLSDARFKIKSRRIVNKQKPVNRINYYRSNKRMVDMNEPKMPLTIGAPRGYVDYDNMESVEDEFNMETVDLRRTVQNDMLPLESYSPGYDDRSVPTYDPFDGYDVGRSHNDDISLRRLTSPLPTKSILRSTSPQSSAPYGRERHYAPAPTPDSSHLSYKMRSRLEHAPNPHQSMGIFANPLKPSSSNPSNYRIVVSNLASGVTQSDIAELFEDIGVLDDARLVRTGVAEVIFKNLKDAEKAVDTYHNRQLDGQPMKCLLVNPNSSNKMTSSMGSKKTPLEIDIDTLHKVLFRRH